MEDHEVTVPKGSLCILWDRNNNRILCVTRFAGVATSLLSSTLEMGFSILAASKPILHSKSVTGDLEKIEPEELLKYIFHRHSGCVVRLENKKPPTDEEKNFCALLAVRARYLRRVTQVISQSRKRVAPSELYGDLVDLLRRQQAILFRDSGYDESLIKDCLFVFQYAQIKKITPRAAADEIIFRFSLFESELWRTEEIKLKYYDLFANGDSIDGLHDIFQDFLREYYLNSHV